MPDDLILGPEVFLGKFSDREDQEITLSQKPTGFCVREEKGAPVFRFSGDIHSVEDLANRETLGLEDLRVGDDLYVPTLFHGYTKVKVSTIDKRMAWADDGTYLAFLEYVDDHRKCWVSIGGANMKAIRRLSLDR